MDIETLKSSVEAFVRAHQAWAPVLVAALAFGESLAVVSLFVPATALLLAIGALIGASELPFWPVWLGAALGAVAGDWLSYALGYRFKRQIYEVWPLSRHPEMIAKGEAFFLRWGIGGIFLGRFFGPARAIVPLSAGVFGMHAGPFQLANVSSACLWAFLLLASGDTLGRAVAS